MQIQDDTAINSQTACIMQTVHASKTSMQLLLPWNYSGDEINSPIKINNRQNLSFNPFGQVHKGLRALLHDTAQLLQPTNWWGCPAGEEVEHGK